LIEFANIIWTAIGLIFAVEGILLSLFPEFLKRMVEKFITMSSETLKTLGLVATSTGVLILWLALG
tara:strand:- start:589 stop:786 length:198 start_codon:yes stop_codon:yes gene_type:complete